MQIQINGKTEQITAATLSELVTALGMESGSLVIEHNRQIIKQEHWSTTPLRQGDSLELLSFVGGG